MVAKAFLHSTICNGGNATEMSIYKYLLTTKCVPLIQFHENHIMNIYHYHVDKCIESLAFKRKTKTNYWEGEYKKLLLLLFLFSLTFSLNRKPKMSKCCTSYFYPTLNFHLNIMNHFRFVFSSSSYMNRIIFILFRLFPFPFLFVSPFSFFRSVFIFFSIFFSHSFLSIYCCCFFKRNYVFDGELKKNIYMKRYNVLCGWDAL